VVGGHEIDSPVRPCNAGFIGYDNAGNQVIITAGHCVRNTYDWRRNGKLLGYAMGWIVSSEGDMGAIWITHNFVGQPLVNTVEGFSVVPRPVHSVQALPLSPATRVCKMARVTRYTCGNILAYNVSWTPEPGLVMNGLLETNVCARPGDSGGPLVTRQLVTAPESVTAIGVLSGGNGAACSDPNIRVYFQPVQPLMDKLELTLMTYW